MEELEKQLPSLKKAANIYFLNPPIQFGGIPQTNTKNTQHTTTKTSKERYERNKNMLNSSIGEIAKVRFEKVAEKSNDFDKNKEL